MTVHRAITSVRTLISRTVGAGAARVGRAWRRHRQLLLSNAAYAAAVAAITATLATRTNRSDLLAALLAGSLAIQRALRGDTDQF